MCNWLIRPWNSSTDQRIQIHMPVASRRETKFPDKCCISCRLFSPCFPESQLNQGMSYRWDFVSLLLQRGDGMVLSDKWSQQRNEGAIKECRQDDFWAPKSPNFLAVLFKAENWQALLLHVVRGTSSSFCLFFSPCLHGCFIPVGRTVQMSWLPASSNSRMFIDARSLIYFVLYFEGGVKKANSISGAKSELLSCTWGSAINQGLQHLLYCRVQFEDQIHYYLPPPLLLLLQRKGQEN